MRVAALALLALLLPSAHADDASAPSSVVPETWQPRDGAVIDFKVLRKGSDFGTHRLTFDLSEDGQLNVRTDVRLKAGFGPVTVYHYRLESRETWQDGQLVALEGKANKNGERETVSAQIKDGALHVDGSEFDGQLDLPVLPSSHWNRQQVYADRMLSTESGEVIEMEASRLGEEILDIGGQDVAATRYRISSEIDVDIWYDEQSRWVKLAFEARGQEIEYVLNALY